MEDDIPGGDQTRVTSAHQHPAVTRLVDNNRAAYSRSGRTSTEWVKRWDKRPDLWMALLRSLAGESLQGTANRRRSR